MSPRYAEVSCPAVLGSLVVLALAGCAAAPTVPQSAARSTSAQLQGKVGAPAADEPLPAEAVQQFEQALVQLNAGHEAMAEAGLSALAESYPDYSGALLNLGILYTKRGQLGEAQQALQRAIERDAANSVAFNQLGIVYRRLGRFKAAEQAYQRAVEIDPNYALAHLNLGVLCELYLQQPERALEAYQRYLAVASEPDSRVSGWINELRRRLAAQPRAARAEQ